MGKKPVRYYPDRGIVIAVPSFLSTEHRATLRAIQVGYGYVLFQSGKPQTYTFKEWAEIINDVYNTETERNRYVIQFLTDIDAQLRPH